MNSLSNQKERLALFALLDEYFQQPSIQSNQQSNQQSSINNTKPTPIESRSLPSTDEMITTSSTKLTESILKNQSLSNSILKQSGLNSTQSNTISKLGSQHSTLLAPHLAKIGVNQIKSSINNKQAAPIPPPTKLKGPTKPEGLSSGKAMGTFSFDSGKDFRKTLLSSDGPMSKEAAAKKKAAIPIPLAVPMAPLQRNPSANYSNNSSSSSLPWKKTIVEPLPPPVNRSNIAKEQGLGRAKAEYDYNSEEPDDLCLKEGDTVVVIEHGS